jgi:hypothetical protein
VFLFFHLPSGFRSISPTEPFLPTFLAETFFLIRKALPDRRREVADGVGTVPAFALLVFKIIYKTLRKRLHF